MEIECTEVINKNAVENNILNTEAMEQLFKTFVKSIENKLFYIKNWLIGFNLDVKAMKNSSEEEGQETD